jgi:hypothetical protein
MRDNRTFVALKNTVTLSDHAMGGMFRRQNMSGPQKYCHPERSGQYLKPRDSLCAKGLSDVV